MIIDNIISARYTNSAEQPIMRYVEHIFFKKIEIRISSYGSQRSSINDFCEKSDIEKDTGRTFCKHSKERGNLI
jgi:hypothetical protein